MYKVILETPRGEIEYTLNNLCEELEQIILANLDFTGIRASRIKDKMLVLERKPKNENKV